jgi:hypothetical protein
MDTKTILFFDKANLYKDKYTQEMIADFVEYWTESSNGKKQRWEYEKTFDIGRRLARWAKNEIAFGKKKPNINQSVSVAKSAIENLQQKYANE